MDVISALDHVRVGVADLEYGMARLEQLTGVRPVRGGSHPSVGTHNALISFGATQYLELIAPDPAQRESTSRSELRSLVEPRVIAWIARTANINTSADVARRAGYKLDGPRDRTRLRPDGKRLTWKLFRVVNSLARDGVAPIPEFIEWDQASLHPSQDSPKGCTLQSFTIEYPQPPMVTTVLGKLGIEAHVKQAMSARLIIVLKTPTGRVELN